MQEMKIENILSNQPSPNILTMTYVLTVNVSPVQAGNSIQL